MFHRIIPVVMVLLALLIAGSFLTPGRPDPAAAHQARPAASTPCPTTGEGESAALVRRYLEEAYNGRNPVLAHDS